MKMFFRKFKVIILLFFTVVLFAAPDPDKYKIYDPTENNKPIANILEANKIKDGLIYNRVSIEDIIVSRKLVDMYDNSNPMLSNPTLSYFIGGFSILHGNGSLDGKSFRYINNMLINNILNRNIKAEYNPNKFQSGTVKDMTNFEDGISDMTLIRYTYGNFFKEPNVLNYNSLNDLYVGILDQFSQIPPIMTKFWSGTIPKTDRIWKVNGMVLTRGDVNPIYLGNMASSGFYPYELTDSTVGSVKDGDIIIVDLLDDGNIDFSGIAFTRLTKDEKPTNEYTRTWIYPIKDRNTESGYYTQGVIPTSTRQNIKMRNTRSTGEVVYEDVEVINRVVVIPREALIKSMHLLPKSMEYIKDLDSSVPFRIIAGRFHSRLNPSYIVATNIKPFTTNDLKPMYKVTTSGNVVIEQDAIKDIIGSSTNNGTVPYIPFNDDSGVNSMLNGIVEIFIAGFDILPKLLLILIFVIFIVDLMYMALREIKMAGNGIESFITKAFDKILRYSMTITMLALYPLFLKQIFFPFVISRLPVYILDLTGTYSFLNITTTTPDGGTILHFPKIWAAMSRSALGVIWSMMAGRLFAAILTIAIILFLIWWFPVWTVRFILTKILVIAPFIVMSVITAVIVAINVVANIFMSAIFMIIVTILASIYFVFGVSDLYMDKFMLIIKILLVTMLQYLVQIMLLVITVASFETISKYISINNIGGLSDIIPMVMVFTVILMIMKVPTKISRTLEQTI